MAQRPPKKSEHPHFVHSQPGPPSRLVAQDHGPPPRNARYAIRASKRPRNTTFSIAQELKSPGKLTNASGPNGKTNRVIEISWPFALIGEVALEHEDDPPDLLTYHTDGFTYLHQPLDILRSFVLYYLWSERCRKHFDDQYSLCKILLDAWVATVEVSMATWKAIKSHCQTKDLDSQLSIELTFRKKWLHLNILGTDNATIRWRYFPPCTFSISLMIEGAVAPPPCKGFTLRLVALVVSRGSLPEHISERNIVLETKIHFS